MDRGTQRPGVPVTNSAPQGRPAAAAPAQAQLNTPKKSRKMPRIVTTVLAVLVVAVVGLGGWWFMARGNAASAIDSGQYQAVFLTTGEVYFGKLKIMNDDYLKLNDIFYVQKKASAAAETGKNDLQQATTDSSAQIELIKLGTEIHGPADVMVINRDQVLYFENLKADGTVTKSIKQYYQGKK